MTVIQDCIAMATYALSIYKIILNAHTLINVRGPKKAKFNNAAYLTGTCVTFYLVPSDTILYAKAEEDSSFAPLKSELPLHLSITGLTKFTPAMIKSGKAILSTNIDKECKASSDCPTSEPRITAECNCRYDMLGIWYCGTGNGEPKFNIT